MQESFATADHSTGGAMHGEILTQDDVQALEPLTEPAQLECCQISLNECSLWSWK